MRLSYVHDLLMSILNMALVSLTVMVAQLCCLEPFRGSHARMGNHATTCRNGLEVGIGACAPGVLEYILGVVRMGFGGFF